MSRQIQEIGILSLTPRFSGVASRPQLQPTVLTVSRALRSSVIRVCFELRTSNFELRLTHPPHAFSTLRLRSFYSPAARKNPPSLRPPAHFSAPSTSPEPSKTVAKPLATSTLASLRLEKLRQSALTPTPRTKV